MPWFPAISLETDQKNQDSVSFGGGGGPRLVRMKKSLCNKQQVKRKNNCATLSEGVVQSVLPQICLVTGKSLDSPEKGNVNKMSEKNVEKCPKNVQKLPGGAENTIFGHVLDNFCLFGRCFCLVTLSNARPLPETCHT